MTEQVFKQTRVLIYGGTSLTHTLRTLSTTLKFHSDAFIKELG